MRKAAPLQAIAGAFIDTRALSGVITFGLLLNRAGSVFGSESFSRIMSLMLGAAEGVTRILGELHIAVPRVTAFVVVFIAAAWLLVFLKKAVGMLRFRISCEGGYVTVRRGVFTLYEFRLVRNNLTGILCCDTLTTLLLRAAPLYAHDVMIFPPVSRRTAYRILSKLCGITPPEPRYRRRFRFVRTLRRAARLAGCIHRRASADVHHGANCRRPGRGPSCGAEPR